jgi:DNA-binding CsgD family transcriptional regulator
VEAGRKEKSAPARKRLTAAGKAARQKRIFALMRQGYACDAIAREEGLTARRVRQIVSEVLRQREAEGGAAQAGLPLSRLAPVLWAAGKLIAEGDVRAVAPLMKVLDWLDRRKTSPLRPTAADSGNARP